MFWQMRYQILFLITITLTGCTINIINTSTHGVATDVVDSDPKTDANVKASVALPISPL